MQRLLLALVALLCAQLLPAQTPAPPAVLRDAQNLAPTAADTTLLWEISGPEIDNPSYLYGTIHIIPEEDYFMPNQLMQALNEVDAFVFEVDTKQMNDPMAMMSMMGKINMRGDTSLADLLTDEEFKTVEEYFSANGLPFMFFQRMKPMFLSMMVGQDIDLSQGMGGMGGLTGMKSYEVELTALAEAREKPVSGLETLDFQLGLFDAIPYEAQAKMLYEAVLADTENDGEKPDQMAEMVDMYKRKAVAEMAASIGDESQGMSNFEDILLTKRNQNWIPLIVAQSQEQAKLFAVGAAHLGGENGVIALLRAGGLTVKPVY